jgi:hypothetical protein
MTASWSSTDRVLMLNLNAARDRFAEGKSIDKSTLKPAL